MSCFSCFTGAVKGEEAVAKNWVLEVPFDDSKADALQPSKHLPASRKALAEAFLEPIVQSEDSALIKRLSSRKLVVDVFSDTEAHAIRSPCTASPVDADKLVGPPEITVTFPECCSDQSSSPAQEPAPTAISQLRSAFANTEDSNQAGDLLPEDGSNSSSPVPVVKPSRTSDASSTSHLDAAVLEPVSPQPSIGSHSQAGSTSQPHIPGGRRFSSQPTMSSSGVQNSSPAPAARGGMATATALLTGMAYNHSPASSSSLPSPTPFSPKESPLTANKLQVTKPTNIRQALASAQASPMTSAFSVPQAAGTSLRHSQQKASPAQPLHTAHSASAVVATPNTSLQAPSANTQGRTSSFSATNMQTTENATASSNSQPTALSNPPPATPTTPEGSPQSSISNTASSTAASASKSVATSQLSISDLTPSKSEPVLAPAPAMLTSSSSLPPPRAPVQASKPTSKQPVELEPSPFVPIYASSSKQTLNKGYNSAAYGTGRPYSSTTQQPGLSNSRGYTSGSRGSTSFMKVNGSKLATTTGGKGNPFYHTPSQVVYGTASSRMAVQGVLRSRGSNASAASMDDWKKTDFRPKWRF